MLRGLRNFAKRSGKHETTASGAESAAPDGGCAGADEDVSQSAAIGDAAPMPLARNETVLVVEDDEAMRNLVKRQLTELGYKVICAPSAAEALAWLDEGLRIDLLFSDIVMAEGMDGVELATKALLENPSLKVLHTSGYCSADTQSANGVRRLLGKPYRKATLALAIREALDTDSNQQIRF